MAHSIKTVYVVHHSHTDIGYTDLQERVIAIQVNYIKTVLSMMRQPEYADFRWNCETLYCVEEFWKQASEDDRADFARFVKEGKIGISANYLNFNDLVNADVFGKRLAKWQDKLQPFGTKIHTAMAADVNGFSMGYRDAMIENGVEFFFTNVHCHHGMYPLYQNQNAFFWENASGQRLLVWNGEHYNLGNVLGLQPNHAVNWMIRNRLGEDADAGTFFSDQLHTNLDKYLTECETEGYPYDFIVTAVSGVFSDNAPPSAEIMETIRAYNEKYGQEVRVEMVSLQELYAAIAPKLTDAPVYRGDWTDWWANGVGSTPYAVKHYKDADHRWQLANRLDPDAETHYPALAEAVQDNLMLYAEHTWGHSSTITNPYDTMVLNLDMRKNSYASKAHEAASLMLCSIAEKKGDSNDALTGVDEGTAAVGRSNVSVIIRVSQPNRLTIKRFRNFKGIRPLAENRACRAGSVHIRPITVVPAGCAALHDDELALVALGVEQIVRTACIVAVVDDLVGTICLAFDLVLVVTAEWNIPLIYGIPLENLKLGVALDALFGFAVDFVDADLYRPFIILHFIVIGTISRNSNSLVAAQRTGCRIEAMRDGDFIVCKGDVRKLRPCRGNGGIHHALRFVLQLPDGRVLGSFCSGIRFGLAGERPFLPAERTGAGLGHLIVNRPCGRTVTAIQMKIVILRVTACGNGLRSGRTHLPAAAVHIAAGPAGRDGNDRPVHLFQRVQLVLVGVDCECQIKASAGSLGRSCPRSGIILRFRNTRHIRDLSAARNFFTDQCHNLPRIVATTGMLCAGAKQVGQRLGCRGAVYPGQFDFTAKILVTEIKGQAPHPAVLRPWLQFSARWLPPHGLSRRCLPACRLGYRSGWQAPCQCGHLPNPAAAGIRAVSGGGCDPRTEHSDGLLW